MEVQPPPEFAMEPNIDLAKVLALFEEFRDRIFTQSRGSNEVTYSLYAIVAMKLFGFAFNTYKTIGLLLPEHYYEQATALHRTLWETGANFEWISRDPEYRSHQFLNFTLIEHRNFLAKRLRTARRNRDTDAIIELSSRMGEFERVVANELNEFRTKDRRNRERWRSRFSGPTLEDVVREIGGEWLDEYDRDYLLGCAYTHGAPSGVLFPIEHHPALTRKWDLERSALAGVVTIHAMIRIDRLWLAFQGKNDDVYLSNLVFRSRETGN
jgi:hypothetical protein